MSEIFNEWKKEGAVNPRLRMQSIARGEWVNGDGMRASLEDYYSNRKSIGSGALSCIRRGMRYVIYSYAEPIGIIYPMERCIMRSRKFSVTTSKHQSLVAGTCAGQGLDVVKEDNDEAFLNMATQ